MLHAANSVSESDSRSVLEQYLAEWRTLAATVGGDAKLIDEEFVGASGVEGRIVPKPDSYFNRFYAARDAYIPYIAALCKIKVEGACATASGKLRQAGAWPEPEAERTLNQDLSSLVSFIAAGMPDPQDPYAFLPNVSHRGLGWFVAATTLTLGVAGGVVAAVRHWGR